MRSIFYFAAITLYYRLPVSGFYQETLLGKFLTRDRVPKKLFLFVPKFLCPPNFQICIFWDFQIWSNLNQTSLCVFPLCFFHYKFPSPFGGPRVFKVEECIAAWQERGGMNQPPDGSQGFKDLGIEPRYILPETRTST